jgi:hypothetical protein
VAKHRTEASSAFTALVNAFFISLGGMIPHINIGILAVIMGAVALVQTLSLLWLWPRWRRERRVARGLILFLVSAAVYGYEIWVAWPLVNGASDTGALTAVMGLLLGTYAIALSRAWELLGGLRRSAQVSQLDSRYMVKGTTSEAPEQDSESAAPRHEPIARGSRQ